MKKMNLILVVLTLPSLLFSALTFTSCGEWFIPGPCTEFSEHETFLQRKAEWSEPENCSFTYAINIGDSSVGELKADVKVTDGVSEIKWHDTSAELDSGTENIYTDEMPEDGFELASITEAYDFFENEWQKRKSEENTKYWIHFNAEYKTLSSGTESLYYPYVLSETISPAEKDADGYGGYRIIITELVINH